MQNIVKRSDQFLAHGFFCPIMDNPSPWQDSLLTSRGNIVNTIKEPAILLTQFAAQAAQPMIEPSATRLQAASIDR